MIFQVREVRLSACCTQTKARPPVALPHCIAARGADMPSDQHRDGNLSMRPRSECCTAPQNLALTSHDPKRSTFLTHTPSAGSGSRLSATGLTVAVMTGTGLSASEDMSGRLTAAQFSAFPGVADWRGLWGAGDAAGRVLAGSFAAGLALVAAIGELAAASGHDPDVDVRPESVTVRLCTAEIQGLTSRDAALAREISAAAARLQAPPDPAAVQHVQ